MYQTKRLHPVLRWHWPLAIIALLLVSCQTPATNLPELATEITTVIQINEITNADDYLCWSPVPARIRLADPQPNLVNVNLSSISPEEGGAVWFQADNGNRPTRETFEPNEEISLYLPGDGTWVSFWVAGQRPSNGSPDVNVVASDENGIPVGTLPLMVRVRKNAETLTQLERDQLLTALAEVHDLENGTLETEYLKHVEAHRDAFRLGIHGGNTGQPLFLAWHRAFLLHLERELQAVDPRVTLPYWRFDQPAPTLFTTDFLGRVEDGFMVELSTTNPIRGWQMDDFGPFVRFRNADESSPILADQLEMIFAVEFNQQYGAINGAIELGYHNFAHASIGGWLGRAISPSDPLFYLLHGNVDRAWAHWQAQFDRFDPTDIASYSVQGSFDEAPPEADLLRGNYAQDFMWPWSETGDVDGWPDISYPMPDVPGTEGPPLPPRPADMIDYLDILGQGLSHGVCYDDIDYFGEPIQPEEADSSGGEDE